MAETPPSNLFVIPGVNYSFSSLHSTSLINDKPSSLIGSDRQWAGSGEQARLWLLFVQLSNWHTNSFFHMLSWPFCRSLIVTFSHARFLRPLRTIACHLALCACERPTIPPSHLSSPHLNFGLAAAAACHTCPRGCCASPLPQFGLARTLLQRHFVGLHFSTAHIHYYHTGTNRHLWKLQKGWEEKGRTEQTVMLLGTFAARKRLSVERQRQLRTLNVCSFRRSLNPAFFWLAFVVQPRHFLPIQWSIVILFPHLLYQSQIDACRVDESMFVHSVHSFTWFRTFFFQATVQHSSLYNGDRHCQFTSSLSLCCRAGRAAGCLRSLIRLSCCTGDVLTASRPHLISLLTPRLAPRALVFSLPASYHV